MKAEVTVQTPGGPAAISTAGRCFVIAEAGTSHNRELSKGRELIHAAAEAGADSIKFQAVFAEEILHPRSGKVPLPGGRIPLYQRFRELEAPRSFYESLKEEAEKAGLFFLCSAFGLRSLRLLEEIGVAAHKIASPELNYTGLVRAAGGCGKPVILSAGVSLLCDIEKALELIPRQRILLHCITAYPAPEEEYNLSVVPLLSGIFGLPAGISDHSADALAVPLTGSSYGAAVLEKHLRPDNSGSGLDDPIALGPAAFAEMVRELRSLETAPLDERKRLCREALGADRFRRISGDGIKRLAPSEKENYGRTNRSIHAVRRLEKGTALTHENTAVLRTEKVLSPGLPPDVHEQILGARLSRPVDAGEGITWKDLLHF